MRGVIVSFNIRRITAADVAALVQPNQSSGYVIAGPQQRPPKLYLGGGQILRSEGYRREMVGMRAKQTTVAQVLHLSESNDGEDWFRLPEGSGTIGECREFIRGD